MGVVNQTPADAEPSPTIHAGKQGKHIPGHNNFQEGNSELTYPDPQALLDEKTGTGVQYQNKEVVDWKKEIGKWVDTNSWCKYPTTRGTIHYDSKGKAHIVPAKPNEMLNP